MHRIEEEGKFIYYPLENLKNKLKRFKRMIMIIIMNCFCGMVDLFLAGTTVIFSPSQISDPLQSGFGPLQNLKSGFVE